ncbi:MAG: GAF domain-containing protein [Mycobacteriaceae bacterium]
METSRTTGSGGEHASSDAGSAVGADVTHTQRLCQTCVEVLDVDGAAVAVMGGAQAREMVFVTDAVAQQLDELQFTLGEGPCVDAFRTREPVQVVDLDSDQAMERWPGFAREATLVGAHSVFAFPLQVGRVRFGVLELYRRTARALSDEAMTSALLIAETLVHAVLVDLAGQDSMSATPQNPEPLFGRREVHQATGMVAVQVGVPIPEALARLRAAAFASQRPILDVARDVVAGNIDFARTRP